MLKVERKSRKSSAAPSGEDRWQLVADVSHSRRGDLVGMLRREFSSLPIDDLEELISDACIAAYNSANTDDANAMFSFIARTSHRLALNRVTRGREIPTEHDQLAAASTAEHERAVNPAAAVEDRKISKLSSHFLKSLNRDEQKLFYYLVEGQLSDSQAARLLKISRDKVRYLRAKSSSIVESLLDGISVPEFCEYYGPAVKAYINSQASEEEAALAREHLELCPTCAERERKFRTLQAQAVSSLVPPILFPGEGFLQQAADLAQSLRRLPGEVAARISSTFDATSQAVATSTSAPIWFSKGVVGVFCVVTVGGAGSYCADRFGLADVGFKSDGSGAARSSAAARMQSQILPTTDVGQFERQPAAKKKKKKSANKTTATAASVTSASTAEKVVVDDVAPPKHSSYRSFKSDAEPSVSDSVAPPTSKPVAP